MTPALRIHASAIGLVLAAVSIGASSEPLELPARFQRYHATYAIDAAGARVETREKVVKILQHKAIEQYKQASLMYSTSIERAEILEAYTLKPDGRRIDAPKSNYQMDINKGRDADAPAFSDRTRLTVIFPDVAVDDVVVLKYRISETEPMFPGHFSIDERFSRMAAYDDVRIRFEIPAATWTQHAVTDMKQATDTRQDGRRVLEWTWSNPAPEQSKRRNWTSWDPDKEPGYAISTFRDYAQIAEAYGARARPKAVASDRVRKLAEELTRGTSNPRQQAQALYEWVATNINFAGNCVGVGAVVPRDQSFVLDNKMGDCKDHATLLQALFAAKGIPTSQALVNSGNTYSLPRIPVISMVNHVILYVPSLNLFLDTTSATTPFGMLPMGDSDKPVLLVDGYKEGLRTPPIAWQGNRQHARTEVRIKDDGSIAGVVNVSSSGLFAVSGRDRLRHVSAQERDEFLKQMYRRDNKTGFGKLESDDPKPLLDRFGYKVTFETEEFARVPGPGAFAVHPLYFTEAGIAMVVAQNPEEEVATEVACFGGTIVEEYVYQLPKGMKVLATPKGVTLNGGVMTYKSSYSLKGSTLTVKRELTDKTPRNVCPASMQREFADMSRKISTDLKAQIVYQ